MLRSYTFYVNRLFLLAILVTGVFILSTSYAKAAALVTNVPPDTDEQTGETNTGLPAVVTAAMYNGDIPDGTLIGGVKIDFGPSTSGTQADFQVCDATFGGASNCSGYTRITIPTGGGFLNATLGTPFTHHTGYGLILFQFRLVDGYVYIAGDTSSYTWPIVATGQFATFNGPQLNPYMIVFDADGLDTGDPCDTGATRICGFTPENGTTIESTDGFADVDFTLDAFLATEDVDGTNRVRVEMTNIDQNVLLFGLLSTNTHTLLNEKLGADDAGHFAFATTTPLPNGNYRVRVILQKTLFFGWIRNPFADDTAIEISKQFIVGEGTFIGNLSQNGFSILYGEQNSRTATSSLALVARCNPLGSAGFDMVDCLSGLLVPDSGQIQTTMEGARNGILSRAPWGYLTRFVTILSSSATSTLPSYTVTFAGNNSSDTYSLAFNPGDMLAGGATLLTNVRDPYNSKNARDIFEPIIKVVVAMMVLLTIVADVAGSHRHEPEVGQNKNKP